MKYRLKISEETAGLDVSGSADRQTAEFIVGEKAYSVRYRAIPDHCLHMVVNGKGVSVFVADGGQGKYVFLNGKTFLVRDTDRAPSRRARRGGPEQTPGDVTPPMPSVVVRIMVEEGDLVKKGQGLIVVTAMKMETTLVAPSDGRVKKINASVDEKVTPGDILVEIEEQENE